MTNDQRARAVAAFAKRTTAFWGDSDRPITWGLGLATTRDNGEDKEPTVLDVRFININFDPNLVSSLFGNEEELKTVKLNEGSLAAIFMGAGGLDKYPCAGSYPLTWDEIDASLNKLHPYTDDDVEEHPNIDALLVLAELQKNTHVLDGYAVQPVLCCIDDLDSAPQDAVDVYFRLHLLSGRFVQPHGVNLDKQFGLLSNNAWTNFGPVLPDDVPRLRRAVRGVSPLGPAVSVTSIDKFPRMTDYIIPSGVRIGDADRVRLGAHLAPGTTVMHEGFVNFNAGTLGASMVEGRISAGVVIGDGTDIGGGASIMGTLSGGGTEVITLGERCLLGANGGTGISLGDDCVVEAGLYVTAGMKVVKLYDNNILVRARELSGESNLLFLRDSTDGSVVVRRRSGVGAELNEALHTND